MSVPVDKIADAPNLLAFYGDYAKTVITLGTGLLAIAVTFMEKLVGDAPSKAASVGIGALWVTLVLAVLAGLWIIAYSSSVLRLTAKCQAAEVALEGAKKPIGPSPTPPDPAAIRAAETAFNEATKRLDEERERLRGGVNVSYWMLGIAAIAFVFLGFNRSRPEASFGQVVEAARNAIALAKKAPVTPTLEFISMTLAPTQDFYILELKESAAKTWTVEVATDRAMIRNIR